MIVPRLQLTQARACGDGDSGGAGWIDRESGVRIQTGQVFLLQHSEHMPRWELAF